MKSKINIEAILKENTERNKSLDAFYDPISGIGSPIERFKLYVDDEHFVLLPNSMKDIPIINGIILSGTITKYLTEVNGNPTPEELNSFVIGLSDLRLDYDFEFWAVTCVVIKHKIGGGDVPFVLNNGQRRLLVAFEKQRSEHKPIRVILLKARQWGGSTLTQIYAAWIQNRVRKNVKWNSIIVALVENQARNIRSMYRNLAKHYPKNAGKITLQPFENSSKNIQIKENESVISIGSMERPDSLRSDNIKIAHLSEVGLWRKTLNKTPQQLISAVKSAIPYTEDTLIVEESTAKGSGNYFHLSWQSAQNDNDAYEPVFVPWFLIEHDSMKIDDHVKFIERMTEYDWFLWGEGATLEGIKWYNFHLNTEKKGDTVAMKEENPTTPAEAFQSSGRRVFSPLYVSQARNMCCEPSYKGELFADSITGPESLKNIRFDNYDGGNLWVWDLPDKTTNVKRRYCVFQDIGGRWKGADWTVIKVVDRYWMLDGGIPEVVAVWVGHLDQDLVAWKAAQISKWYNNALLAVEVNILDTNEEGSHHLTVLDQIAPHYDNLYARIDPEKINQGIPVRYGFHTSKSTKILITDTLNAALRDTLYVEKDSRACDEMDYFVLKDNGKIEAIDGQHDDHVIATAGVVWLAIEHMEPPVLVQQTHIKKKRIINEATI